MSLKYILAQFTAEPGIDLNNPDERAYAIYRVNQAAKELYEGRDLVNCERELTLSLDDEEQLIALPSYIGKVRGVRDATTHQQITLNDFRPRYKSDGWTNNGFEWRLRERRAIQREITNAAPVTLTIPEAETASFSVTIGGPTQYSGRQLVTVTFAVGETSKQVPCSFQDIEIFANAAPHQYDVTMTDASGNVLAVLPNWVDKSEYQIVQVMDTLNVPAGSPYLVDVLYKMAWRPMREDYDEFLCSGYDDAIYWQALGNYKGKIDANQAVLCLQKAKAIADELGRDEVKAIEMKIDFKPNPMAYPCGVPGATVWKP